MDLETLDLVAVEFAGFICLYPAGGGAFVARGQTVEDALARLTEDELALPCPRCHAAAGEKCRNYLGQGKFTCSARLHPESVKPTVEPAKQDMLF